MLLFECADVQFVVGGFPLLMKAWSRLLFALMSKHLKP